MPVEDVGGFVVESHTVLPGQEVFVSLVEAAVVFFPGLLGVLRIPPLLFLFAQLGQRSEADFAVKSHRLTLR